MNTEQIPEIVDLVEKIEGRLLKEVANLIDARDVPFVIAVYTSALSRVLGAIIALSKDKGLRDSSHEAINVMIGIAIKNANATYAADEAIEKASTK